MNPRYRNFLIAITIGLALFLVVPQSQAQTTRIIRAFANQDTSGAFLGIRMTEVTQDNMAQYKLSKVEGVIVNSVVEGSPAESAGIKKDDVLLSFDGERVRSTLQLSRLVRETPVGREVALTLSRDGKQETMKVQLEEQEAARAENNQDFLEPFFGATPRGNFSFEMPERPDRGMVMPAPDRPRLGVMLQPLSDQMAEYLGVPGGKGALVSSVDEGSVSQGKLKAGDVIVGADGKEVASPEDVSSLVRQKSSGSIDFKVIRDKKQVSVTVQMGDGGGKGFRL
jgi:serine protease Do